MKNLRKTFTAVLFTVIVGAIYIESIGAGVVATIIMLVAWKLMNVQREADDISNRRQSGKL